MQSGNHVPSSVRRIEARKLVRSIRGKTNRPQAWSSSRVFTLIQSLLGLYPYAPVHALFVDPHLPPWLPESNLHVGQAVVAIRFYREDDGTGGYEVLEKRGAAAQSVFVDRRSCRATGGHAGQRATGKVSM